MTATAILEHLSPEAIQHTINDARRVVTARTREIEDMKDTAAYTVKRSPLLSVASAFGAGVLLGATVGWIAHRPDGVVRH